MVRLVLLISFLFLVLPNLVFAQTLKERVLNKTLPIFNNGRFGNSIATNGDFVLVGARGEYDVNGRVYIYKQNRLKWELVGSLGGHDINFYVDDFGSSMAIDGDYAIIGAVTSGSPKGGRDVGSAQIYKQENEKWSHLQQLNPLPRNSFPFYRDDIWFGYSVDISGENIIIGAPKEEEFVEREGERGEWMERGGAYIFQRQGNIWELQEHLKADFDEWPGSFGLDVAISEEYASVLQRHESAYSVYFYYKEGGDWVFDSKLEFPEGYVVRLNSLSMSGENALLGLFSSTFTGAVLYRREGHQWQEESILLDDFRVFNTSLSENKAVIGGDQNGDYFVGVFEKEQSIWQQKTIISSGGREGFGFAVAHSDEHIAVGIGGALSTKAYVYSSDSFYVYLDWENPASFRFHVSQLVDRNGESWFSPGVDTTQESKLLPPGYVSDQSKEAIKNHLQEIYDKSELEISVREYSGDKSAKDKLFVRFPPDLDKRVSILIDCDKSAEGLRTVITNSGKKSVFKEMDTVYGVNYELANNRFFRKQSGEVAVFIGPNGIDPNNSEYDFERLVAETAAHELGHAFGLAHINPEGEPATVMDYDITDLAFIPQFHRNVTNTVNPPRSDLTDIWPECVTKKRIGNEVFSTHNPIYHIRRYVLGENGELGSDLAAKYPPGDYDLETGGTPVAIETSALLSGHQEVKSYPNPFSSSTSIEYTLSTPDHVTLKIINVLGQEIETIIDEHQPAGTYVQTLESVHLASGVYYFFLKKGSHVTTGKIVLAR